MQQNNPHNIMDADKNAHKRLIAAVILQATADLEIPDDAKANKLQHKKDAIEFFWGRNSQMSDAYLTLIDYEPKQFKAKLKAMFEANALPVIA